MADKCTITERSLRAWIKINLEPGNERAWLDDKLPGYRATLRCDLNGNRRLILQVYKRIKGGRPLRRNLLDWQQDRTLVGQEAQARKLAGEILLQTNQGVDLTELAKHQKTEAERLATRTTTLEDAFNAYLKGKHLKESTRATARRAVNQMLTHAGPLAASMMNTAISEIRAATVRDIHSLHSARSPAAANNAMRSLSAAISLWADGVVEDDDDIQPPRNPIRLAMRRKGGKEAVWSEVRPRDVHIDDAGLADWWRATKSLAPDIQWALRLMLLTGLRVSEVTGLWWQNVKDKSGEILITGTKNGRDLTLPLTVGIKETLPLRPQLARGLVFPAVSPRRLRHAHDIIERETGKRVVNHDLRRTFASVAVRVGVSLPVIKKLMNHATSSRDVTAFHYIKTDTADLATALDRIHGHIMDHVNRADVEEVKEKTTLSIVG